jgi:nitrite reductase (NADH) large subunit
MLFNLGTPAAEVGVVELADDAQVCNCNGVSKAALVHAVEGGCRTVNAVMAGPGGSSGRTTSCRAWGSRSSGR